MTDLDDLVTAIKRYGTGMYFVSKLSPSIQQGDIISVRRPQIDVLPGSSIDVTLCVGEVNIFDDPQVGEISVLIGTVLASTNAAYVSGAPVYAMYTVERGALVLADRLFRFDQQPPSEFAVMRDFCVDQGNGWNQAKYRPFDPTDALSFVPPHDISRSLLLSYLRSGLDPLYAVTRVLEHSAMTH
jgi:hypothetical protein